MPIPNLTSELKDIAKILAREVLRIEQIYNVKIEAVNFNRTYHALSSKPEVEEIADVKPVFTIVTK